MEMDRWPTKKQIQEIKPDDDHKVRISIFNSEFEPGAQNEEEEDEHDIDFKKASLSKLGSAQEKWPSRSDMQKLDDDDFDED